MMNGNLKFLICLGWAMLILIIGFKIFDREEHRQTITAHQIDDQMRKLKLAFNIPLQDHSCAFATVPISVKGNVGYIVTKACNEVDSKTVALNFYPAETTDEAQEILNTLMGVNK